MYKVRLTNQAATGATVISDVDSIPKSFILLRRLMHWIGGMGIIVLMLSFLRNLGADARSEEHS